MIVWVLILLYFSKSLQELDDCGKITDDQIPIDRITSGYDVGYYRYPWFAALIDSISGEIECGGVLIGPRTVLTAARCFKRYFSNSKALKLEDFYGVKLGVYNICINESTSRTFKVQKVILHELYNFQKPFYDISLITLNNDTSEFVPICLPESPIKPAEGFVVGLGSLQYNGSLPCSLHEARMLIFSKKFCKNAIKSTGNNENLLIGSFCAGYTEKGPATCQGDAGGPLQALNKNNQYILIGLISFGYQCALPQPVNVYTDVFYFINWIKIKSSLYIDPFLKQEKNQKKIKKKKSHWSFIEIFNKF